MGKRSSDDDGRTVKPFSAYLVATNKGRTHRDLSEGMVDLTEEVLRTGKQGSLTLTVNVKVDDAESRRLVVSETVALKMPKPTARTSVFWADGDGNLVRADPSQLAFGDIAAVPDDVKEAQA